MNQSADILILIEHVARELDVACAVRHLAQSQYGLSVEIASMGFGVEHFECLPAARVLAVPYFYSARDHGIRELLVQKSEAPIVNLAYEQLFSNANKKFKRPKGAVAREHVIHCAAGEFFREFLQDSGVPKENIAVIGGLACGLTQPPYRRFFESRRAELAKRHQLDPHRRWLFFPENYAAAFFSDKEIARRVRGGFTKSDMQSYLSFTRKSFAIVMNWCAEAARAGLAEVVIRPRPATNRNAFLDAIHEVVPNVPENGLHVIADGSVREWMLSSEMTVSSYSSTIVEAAAAGKPVCLAAPLPFPESVLADWNDAAPQAVTQEEFFRFVSNPERFGSPLLTDWISKNLLASGDAIDNLTRLLAEIAQGERLAPRPPTPSRAERWRLVGKRLRRKWKQSLRNSARRSARIKFLTDRDWFSHADVAERTAVWQHVLQPVSIAPANIAPANIAPANIAPAYIAPANIATGNVAPANRHANIGAKVA